MANTTISSKTYKATFQSDRGQIAVSGLQAWLITETPDNSHRLEMQRAYRAEIRVALEAAGVPAEDVYMAEWVHATQA